MKTVYIDTLFIINLSVDYLLLMGTAKICHEYISRLRAALGAFIGASYSIVTLIFPYSGNPLIALSVGAFMVLVVFGGKKRLLKALLVFFGLSALACGVITALSAFTGKNILFGIDLKIFIISFALCYAAVTFVFSGIASPGKKTELIKISLNGKTVELTAFVDTGNVLTDPMSGKNVIVAEASEMVKLFSPEAKNAIRRISKDEPADVVKRLSSAPEGRRFRLVPYSSVGIEGGMLVAFRPDSVSISNKKEDGFLVAFSPTKISHGGSYSALMGVM